MGFGTTGKLGRAWVSAWVSALVVYGIGGLDGDAEEVAGVESCEKGNYAPIRPLLALDTGTK